MPLLDAISWDTAISSDGVDGFRKSEDESGEASVSTMGAFGGTVIFF